MQNDPDSMTSTTEAGKRTEEISKERREGLLSVLRDFIRLVPNSEEVATLKACDAISLLDQVERLLSELAARDAEIAQLKAAAAPTHYCRMCGWEGGGHQRCLQCELSLAKLVIPAAVVSPSADTERLDWLERNRFGVIPGMPPDKHDYWGIRTYGKLPYLGVTNSDVGDTLRGAIDAARSVQPVLPSAEEKKA